MNNKQEESKAKLLLWGASNSAFSAKLRCFLIKSGLAFQERFPIEPRFSEEILPRIGYWVVPVTELEDGTLLQDSTESMLHLERTSTPPRSLIPKTPLLRGLAHLLTFFGSDGFLKPGMHYRWSYLKEQRTYLEAAFSDWIPNNASDAERRERLDGIMAFFNGYGPSLGITEATTATIEASWIACLDILNAHFSVCPYLLGGAPSIADCGLITMLGPHLSRDPVPAYLMRTRAPMVARWVERMHRPDAFDGGFPLAGTEFSEVDEMPPSLLPFLAYLASDVAPEVAATIDRFNEWVTKNHSGERQGWLDDPNALIAHPDCGQIEYELRGREIHRLGFVDTVYQFQRALELLGDATAKNDAFQMLMESSGLSPLTRKRPVRRIGYVKYRYTLE